MKDQQFRHRVWEYYVSHKRLMPWRERHDFYWVIVSELMLQQTQVSRVTPIFLAFVKKFPTLEILAASSLADVLIAWQGLGYNRRAKYLHQSAQIVSSAGTPQTIDELTQLPGIGPNTAAAICAYVYNQPVVFIETNIRTVYMYEFFRDQSDITDSQIRDIVARTIDINNPREWYWALMDYGAYLKSQKLGSIKKSASYMKQSQFQGSLRQARGDILRRLADGPAAVSSLTSIDDRYPLAYSALLHEGLIEQQDDIVSLTAHGGTS